MKKFVSLLMTVVMLAAMLTVFAVPASAEETKTAGEYKNLALQLKSEQKYEEAADAYMNAGRLYMADKSLPADLAFSNAGGAFYDAGWVYKSDLDNHAFAAEAFIKSGLCFMKAGQWNQVAGSYHFAGGEYKSAGDDAAAGEAYLRAGGAHIKTSNWREAAEAFDSAAQSFGNSIPFSAAAANLGKAYAYQKSGNNSLAEDAISAANQILNGLFEFDFNTGSTLSEGSLTIICSVACLAVGFLAAMFIFKKKKKPAVAGAAESDE